MSNNFTISNYAAVDAFGDPLPQSSIIRPYWAARWIQNAWRNAPWRNRSFETQYPSYQAMQRARREGRRLRPVRARRNLGHFRTPQNLRRAQNAFQALLRNVNRASYLM